MHACLYIYVFVLGVHLPTYVMWKPEVNAGSLPRSLSTLILETRSLVLELNLELVIGYTGWSGGLLGVPVSAPSGCRCMADFFMAAGI